MVNFREYAAHFDINIIFSPSAYASSTQTLATAPVLTVGSRNFDPQKGDAGSANV
jgi:hypothetical protein